MEELLAELVPVAEWEWWLWRVTWKDDAGQTKTLWCVETDTHVEAEVDRRWPSDHWTTCTWEPVQPAPDPQELWCPALQRRYPENPWDAGFRLAQRLNLC